MLFGLFAVFCLIAFGCKKEEEANTCKKNRTGDLACEQASGYKCSELLFFAENEIEGSKRYFIFDRGSLFSLPYNTCDKFHIKASVELKNILTGLSIDMVISHGLTSDTITFKKDSLGIYSMDEHIIDLPSLYPNLDQIVIHHPIRLWLTSTGSFTNDKNLVESVLQRVYVEKQVGKME